MSTQAKQAVAALDFVVSDPETGRPVEFQRGDDVPQRIVNVVGDHVLVEPGKRTKPKGSAAGGTAGEGGGFTQAEVDEQIEAAVAEAVEQAGVREQAAYDLIANAEAPFDPAADGVNADEVNAYLTGLDRTTVSGRGEFDRVTKAEISGKNRTTALVDDD